MDSDSRYVAELAAMTGKPVSVYEDCDLMIA